MPTTAALRPGAAQALWQGLARGNLGAPLLLLLIIGMMVVPLSLIHI